jgi:hypothetical protein
MWFAFLYVFPADKFCDYLSTTLSPNLSPVEGERLKRLTFGRSENGGEDFALHPSPSMGEGPRERVVIA